MERLDDCGRREKRLEKENLVGKNRDRSHFARRVEQKEVGEKKRKKESSMDDQREKSERNAWRFAMTRLLGTSRLPISLVRQFSEIHRKQVFR